tara:strand:- start:99 stop:419 length:321 start_codon:yes stop_codon:yes gene_type:complete
MLPKYGVGATGTPIGREPLEFNRPCLCLTHVASDDGWRIIDDAPSPLVAHSADDTHRAATESAVDEEPAALRAASVMTRRSMIRSTLDRCARQGLGKRSCPLLAAK